LVLPPVCVILGWTYLVNDHKVTAIGQYIRRHLAPALSALAGQPAFGWEVNHRDDARRRRKHLQLGVDLATFCLPGLAALTAYWTRGPWTIPLLAVSVVEAVAALVLACQIVAYADLARGAE